MTSRARMILAMAASAVAAVAATETVTRRVMRPHPVPAEMAEDVVMIENIGFTVAQACPVGCYHRRRMHIHVLSPGGMALTVARSDRPEHGYQEVHLS